MIAERPQVQEGPGQRRWIWLICSVILFGLASFFLYPVFEPQIEAKREPEPRPASIEVVEHPQPVKTKFTPSVPRTPVKSIRITPPQPIRQVNPSIPEGIRNRIHGVVPVNIAARVGSSGAVTHAEIVGKAEGIKKYLALQALEAVRHWKFRPARQNGKAVPGQTVVRFRFRRSQTEWN